MPDTDDSGRVGQVVDGESLMKDLLAKAARLWIAEHPPSEPYSTVQNEFLWAAERAWFDARDAVAP